MPLEKSLRGLKGIMKKAAQDPQEELVKGRRQGKEETKKANQLQHLRRERVLVQGGGVMR